MIEIRIVIKDGIIQSHYNFEGKNNLRDVAIALLEVEMMKDAILYEAEKFKPDVEISGDNL